MAQSICGLLKRRREDGSYVWHIDKRVRRYGRLCESTGTADREEAERYLAHRLRELREIRIYGERPERTFRDAIQRYLDEYSEKKSINRDQAVLMDIEPFIGNLPLDRINNDSLARYRRARGHLSIRTRNQKIALVQRVLRLAANVWCFPGTNLTWLEKPPEILMESGHRGRQPYSLDKREQELLFTELAPYAAEMAAFAVNRGVRDRERRSGVTTPSSPTSNGLCPLPKWLANSPRTGNAVVSQERALVPGNTAPHNQSTFNQRAAASAVSSGRVLNAMTTLGAALWTALTTLSNNSRLFGGSRRPPPITTQS
jgi:hypothetical protein